METRKVMQVGILQSVQVGTPRHYNDAGEGGDTAGRWETSFVRAPSTERRRLYTTHLQGNAQADTKNHGKPGQAVLLYAAAHYPAWRSELGLPEIGPGGFAENFTLDGLSEATACIGDTYAIGEARIQVTGPR
jgi:MOSC domain-containing protein YiiM